MAVRDDEGEEGLVRRSESCDFGERDDIVSKRIQRPAHVKHDSRVSGLILRES
jgi:hypothetical protein